MKHLKTKIGLVCVIAFLTTVAFIVPDRILAVKAEIVQKAGAWFSYNGQRLGQGRDKVKELLRTDTALAKDIETKLWENIDKLYDRKRPAPKAKVTAVAEAKPEPAAPKKDTPKIDVLVDE